jgi:uncharacterized protein
MASKIKEILNTGKYDHPSYVKETHYEVLTGSQAYGTNTEDSDFDIYSFCVPPKHVVFPYTAGIIPYFGSQGEKFEQFQLHHVIYNTKEYDMQVYNIVKFFQLCMENNPNMVDTLFVPPNCILHKTKIGDMVRDSRKLFIHKGCWHKFKGYAFSQLKKVMNKKPEGSRLAIVEKYGFDVKFAAHIPRLMDECEQLLLKGEMDLQRSREFQKAIKTGYVTLEQIVDWYYAKLHDMEKLYESSKLPYSPDEAKIKNLLLNCLEEHYGTLTFAACTWRGATIDAELQKITDAVNKIQGEALRWN